MEPAVKPIGFTLTLNGAFKFATAFPLQIKALMFRHRDATKTIQYSYQSAGTNFISMVAGEVYKKENILWRNPEIYIKGTNLEIVEGVYWI